MPLFRTIVFAAFVLIIGQRVLAPADAQCAEWDTDLYRVYIANHEDANLLAQLPIDPLWRLGDGYLVLAPSSAAGMMTLSGLRYAMVAADVARGDLAIDISRNDARTGEFPTVFTDGGLRLVRLPFRDYLKTTMVTGLAPIRTSQIPIEYRTPARLDKMAVVDPADLDSLIGSISIDSLVSYSNHLQAYNGRWVGSYGNIASANWAQDKFIEFGYDSVVVDTFTELIDGRLRKCRNVLAYKIGTEFPYHHIVVGAHRDSEVGSPGADDNGSGMAAVLDIARVWRSTDTRATIVFALFDAEEWGLLGSFHYVQEALQQNERIPFMLNMDMISYYENENEAKVCYEAPSEPFAQLWIDLADSISSIGITGYLVEGFGSSDHESFSQYGYDAIFAFENVLSTVFHTPQDSTTYMNFGYMTRMVMACLATAHTADRQFVPDYDLVFYCPEPFPELLPPDQSTALALSILPYGGAAITLGSAYLHYTINNDPPDSVPLTEIGNGQFTGSLPNLGCFNKVTYRVSVHEDSLGLIYYPESPVRAYVAVEMDALFEDDFRNDLGWQTSGDASYGDWDRCLLTYNYGMGTPQSDVDGNNYAFVTDSTTNTDVDGGTVTLISPVVDASAGNIILRYARWYSNDYPIFNPDPHNDIFEISISNNNGSTWVPLETVGPVDEASGGWYLMEFLLDDYVMPSNQVRLRFDASDLGTASNVEAAVDAVRFLALTAGPSVVTTDLPDWTVGCSYLQQLEAAVCEGDVIWTDKYNQLSGTGLSLASEGTLSGTPTGSGIILFTAGAEATAGGTAEQLFSFVINSAIVIATPTTASGILGESYLCQLNATGGTGTRIWSDRDDGLEGTGVTLSGSGLLSGTPAVEGDFPFTALVTDQVGATTEKAFTLHIVSPYVCGDADGDGAVNVGDAVFVINYVFKSGSPPAPIESGDANADGDVNVADAVYLINFIFKGGPPPQCP